MNWGRVPSELVFLGKELHEQRNYSERVAFKIDEEVHKFIQDSNEAAKKIVTENRSRLKLIAEQLIATETIVEEEFEKLMTQVLPSVASELETTPAS
jgi:cell division protease FtsH